MKVLVVDDNPKALLIAKARLVKEGIDVICAGGGKQCLEIAREERPDLILLDIDMPDLSGFEVCNRLKEEETLCMVPIIFLTAADDNGNRIRGLDLGAVDYVTKPFDAFELRARVRAALRTKKLQDQLTNFNQKLEKKVEERTSRVQQLLQQKNAFVNQLSHDLKTPLTPLVALLPLIAKRTEDSEAKRMLNLAIDSVNYMRNLTETILQLARLNSSHSQLKPEKIDIAFEIQNIINALSSLFSERKISPVINTDTPLLVECDEILIKELLHNLISNAIKYTNSGGVVTVRGFCNNNQIQISISDTGIGMTDEQIDHAFEEFYKADDSRNDRSSTGLGLSICRKIIEKSEGKIQIESPGLGKGTTVGFSIPRCIENEK
ncbi:MAG: response regulator [Candidatus Scalindua sp. AMX11]|nr:MAG: response regulator [Candidatus Scalindua sp.]NOG84496.1 hybrid sensor histidine kinase/response regulator [Planctomycetota bacterium]RZV80496.1 MAG: response regulator [Candidatus Scalindua sp. SCAELEC01]TDE65283.1 MAG: response regulator [Candidatus Scalindua sp. AMX11]GJQ58497.1 MAG: hybrid sensor histidine kinase/response regulator [Candidatus Scalindua sp.]